MQVMKILRQNIKLISFMNLNLIIFNFMIIVLEYSSSTCTSIIYYLFSPGFYQIFEKYLGNDTRFS